MPYTDEWFISLYGPRPSTKNHYDLELQLWEASRGRNISLDHSILYYTLAEEERRLVIWEAQRQSAMSAFHKAEQEHQPRQPRQKQYNHAHKQRTPATSSLGSSQLDRTAYIAEIKQQLVTVVPELAHDSALFMSREAVQRFLGQAVLIEQLYIKIALLQKTQAELEEALDSALQTIT